MIGLARFFRGLFLWILGHKYSSLRFEVFLIMAMAHWPICMVSCGQYIMPGVLFIGGTASRPSF
jgi:hypothetical protein